MAHQTLAQVPRELQSLILGNVGLQVVFRVNRQDAERLAKESFQYSGYQIKSATLHNFNYWSLGEEWERYTELLQRLNSRQAWIKHKIEGGLIPIETVDVDPPWEALGVSPFDFGELLAEAQIGASYLRARSELDAVSSRPTPRPVVPGDEVSSDELVDSNAPPPLDDDARRFLTLTVERPELTISQLYTAFGASAWKGARLRQELVETGDLIELETRRGAGGRLAKFLLPTEQALERLGAELPEGGGGALHRHLQQLVAAEAEAHGYRTTIEHPLESGGLVDVEAVRTDERLAVEISVTSNATRELEHIRACLDAGYDRVISLAVSERIYLGIGKRLAEVASPAERERVHVMRVRELGGLF